MRGVNLACVAVSAQVLFRLLLLMRWEGEWWGLSMSLDFPKREGGVGRLDENCVVISPKRLKDEVGSWGGGA
jgi:hypothetical protein